MTSFSSRSKWRLAVVGGNTHLCLWGAPFISNQQQIALSVNNNLFLESATCHTHKKSRYTRKTDREEDRQTWASLAENYTLGCCPAGHCERLGGGLGPAASHQWGCKRTSELRLRCAFENRARPGQNTASRATLGRAGAEGGIFVQALCEDCRPPGTPGPRSSETENAGIVILWLFAKRNRIFRACQVPGLPTNWRAEDPYSPQEKPSSGWTQTPQGWCFRGHRWGRGDAALLHRVTQSGAAG